MTDTKKGDNKMKSLDSDGIINSNFSHKITLYLFSKKNTRPVVYADFFFQNLKMVQ